jgi:hypothetical protein
MLRTLPVRGDFGRRPRKPSIIRARDDPDLGTAQLGGIPRLSLQINQYVTTLHYKSLTIPYDFLERRCGIAIYLYLGRYLRSPDTSHFTTSYWIHERHYGRVNAK